MEGVSGTRPERRLSPALSSVFPGMCLPVLPVLSCPVLTGPGHAVDTGQAARHTSDRLPTAAGRDSVDRDTPVEHLPSPADRYCPTAHSEIHQTPAVRHRVRCRGGELGVLRVRKHPLVAKSTLSILKKNLTKHFIILRSNKNMMSEVRIRANPW